jgi:hypothetical protein
MRRSTYGSSDHSSSAYPRPSNPVGLPPTMTGLPPRHSHGQTKLQAPLTTGRSPSSRQASTIPGRGLGFCFADYTQHRPTQHRPRPPTKGGVGAIFGLPLTALTADRGRTSNFERFDLAAAFTKCHSSDGANSSRQIDVVVVRTAGVEPAQPCGRGILSPLRLPVSPRPHR